MNYQIRSKACLAFQVVLALDYFIISKQIICRKITSQRPGGVEGVRGEAAFDRRHFADSVRRLRQHRRHRVATHARQRRQGSAPRCFGSG